MNRAERRAKGIKGKALTYNLTAEAIHSIIEETRQESIKEAFVLMLTLPTIVIRDKFGELMKKDGREERFTRLVLKQFEMFQNGYMTLEDLKECLQQETGIRFEDLKRGKLYD